MNRLSAMTDLPPLDGIGAVARGHAVTHYPHPPAAALPVDPTACERLLSGWFDRSVVLLGSGRAGIHLYLQAKGFNRYRDRVWVPPYMSLCVLDTLARRALPVEDGDGHAVTLLYHQYGLSQTARPPGTVLEDICHQFFGAPHTGARQWMGEAAVFSLPKFLAIEGMGGGIVTADADLAARIRELRDSAEAELPGARTWMRRVIGTTYRDPAASSVAPLLESAYALLTRYPRPDPRDLAGFPVTAEAIAAVGSRRRAVLRHLIDALGPDAAPADILGALDQRPPFAFPYFGCGDRVRLEALNRMLAENGIHAGVYNIDVQRDMSARRYRPCILLPCHQDLRAGDIEVIADILGRDRH